MKTTIIRNHIKNILIDQMLFMTNEEIAKAVGSTTDSVRSQISVLRKQGYQIAKLARKHPSTGKMLHAHYYTPYHSRDLDIEEHVKLGRPARIDAYANPVVRT